MADIEGSGLIKAWWWKTGTGFIVPDGGGPDILFGVACFPALRNLVATGERVEYVAHQSDKGWRATKLTLAMTGKCPCCGAMRAK